MIVVLVALSWLFLIYSFIGWVLETGLSAIRKKHFINRGLINGPFCLIYGVAALAISFGTTGLHGIWLFIGSMIIATVVEWVAGRLIERLYHERWWDYSSMPLNLDGYISVPSSFMWGVLGFIVVKWGNQLFLHLAAILPSWLVLSVVIVVNVLIIVDAIITLIILSGRSKKVEKWEARDAFFDKISGRLSKRIYRFVDRRINHAYEPKNIVREEVDPNIFAAGCSVYKLILLFIIGALLGDFVETIFCRIVGGVWMSRSSLVWGPFSVVWGMAMAAATALLYRYRHHSDSFIFLMGTFLGGAYEYICSVITEKAFGTVFWDYSEMPFNLGGRINLLYCFFWGVAAVVWLKVLYPIASKWIEKIPKKPGTIITWCLTVFMICNIIVSALALGRYNERHLGIEATDSWQIYMDAHYDDAKMEKIYPNALMVE